jgi:hypothetical protein
VRHFISEIGKQVIFLNCCAGSLPLSPPQDRLPDSKDFKCSLWNPLAKMSIGAAASILAQTVTFPIDTVRRRMQMSGAPGTSTAYSGYWCVVPLRRS